jgi:outer membrane lipoprotein-sorting protein
MKLSRTAIMLAMLTILVSACALAQTPAATPPTIDDEEISSQLQDYYDKLQLPFDSQ